MAKVNTKFRRENAKDLALEIYTDKEYTKIVKNLGLQDKIKEIIVEHGPFTDSEIGVFVEENLKHPMLEEIFDDFNGNKDIRNAMKKYGVIAIHRVMPELIYLEFFGVNENAD